MTSWRKATKIIRPTDFKKPRKWTGAREGEWVVRTPIGKWLHRVEGQLCRMPTYFPNYDMAMIPLRPEQIKEYQSTGHITSALQFKTSVKMNKIEIKKYLQTLYGLDINRVHTAVILGKKYQSLEPPFRFFRKSDWKKVWVYLNAPKQETEFDTAHRGHAASAALESAAASSRAVEAPAVTAAPSTSKAAEAEPQQQQQQEEEEDSSSKGGFLSGLMRSLRLSVSPKEGGSVDRTLASTPGSTDRGKKETEFNKAKRY